jgi:hypothetical protein
MGDPSPLLAERDEVVARVGARNISVSLTPADLFLPGQPPRG